MDYKTLSVKDLRETKTLWIASVGTLDHEDDYRWKGFCLPTETAVYGVRDTMDYYIRDEYVSFMLVGWEQEFQFRLDSNGYLEKKYHQHIGLTHDQVFENWFHNLKVLLKDDWSGVNKVRANDILKEYLATHHYDYFIGKYPELLI